MKHDRFINIRNIHGPCIYVCIIYNSIGNPSDSRQINLKLNLIERIKPLRLHTLVGGLTPSGKLCYSLGSTTAPANIYITLWSYICDNVQIQQQTAQPNSICKHADCICFIAADQTAQTVSMLCISRIKIKLTSDQSDVQSPKEKVWMFDLIEGHLQMEY